MGTTIVFGAGALGQTLFPKIEQTFGGDFIFVDNNPVLWGTSFLGKPVISPTDILCIAYDRIVITTIGGFETIPAALVSKFGISLNKIDVSFIKEIYDRTIETRNYFLKRFAEIVYKKGLAGNVAEGGVFEGSFARRINAEFPDRRLYLFDTFEGFDERDTILEQGDMRNRAKHYNANITEEALLATMPHPEQIVMRKGYFPETAIGVDDSFVFVNLDFDLYNPTLSGLEFFYPKLVRGGIILVHDYFHGYVIQDKALSNQGILEAVDKFSREHDVAVMPIGDELSIAIISL